MLLPTGRPADARRRWYRLPLAVQPCPLRTDARGVGLGGVHATLASRCTLACAAAFASSRVCGLYTLAFLTAAMPRTVRSRAWWPSASPDK